MSSAPSPDRVVMRDVIIVGGGCYGTFYAGQLAKARERGKARYRRVIIVDRDSACRARVELGEAPERAFVTRDRKSTRLNSSHANISYAVFCLKKKNKDKAVIMT